MSFEKIVIASSPRCGTNMLQVSLSTHPSAINAGEVLNEFDKATDQDWLAERDRSAFIAHHNLFKLLSIYHDHADFGQFMGWGLRVYLYRKDIDAQMRSWRTAATSGIWSSCQAESQESFDPSTQYMASQIELADSMFLRSSHLAVAYEDLVSRWDRCVAGIQATAGWPVVRIAKQTKPLTI